MTIFTTEQLTPAERIAKEIKTLGNLMFSGTVRSYMSQFDKFWRNPEATPQEVAVAYGTDCLKLFMTTEALRQAIVAVDPNALPPEYQGAQLPYTFETIDNIPLAEGGVLTGRVIIG